MELTDAHPSHTLIAYDLDTDSIHTDQYKCTTCEEMHCALCFLAEDDDLAVTCIGYSWVDSMRVTGPDDITRTVKKCGIGWF